MLVLTQSDPDMVYSDGKFKAIQTWCTVTVSLKRSRHGVQWR